MSRKFILSSDERYQVPGTVVVDIEHFIDPDQRFVATDVARVNALGVGERIDLGDGRAVERAE
ncbi:hypothetical protein PQR57_46075 [Paraburkholderia dipogonis]|jgi:hypothetical protein|uniref:Uncharacterized protein n=1 Tax=Paraburkholderia dipogonis TaxID=1211383 RepID=A0ABW9B9A3_9BURK